jgi:casein kinase II subunit beta
LEKYKKAEFGRCPRVLCNSQAVIPVGLSDLSYNKLVKVYCPRCQDIYAPKSSRHASIDGAYFGTTFAHMLFMVYPNLVPQRSTERYVPKIFGFKIHEISKQHRKQDEIREEQQRRLAQTSTAMTAQQQASSLQNNNVNNPINTENRSILPLTGFKENHQIA